MIRRLLVCGALLGFLAAVGCDGGNTPDPKISSPNAPKLEPKTPGAGGAGQAPGKAPTAAPASQ